jgi:hypothetical protein
MKRVVVAEEAVQDLEEARAFYDYLEPGVGEYCVDSLLADVVRLGLYHGFHGRHFGCLRMLGTRFPFGIYYLDEPEEIRVIAILDLRRDPNWLRTELERRED